MYGAKKLVGPSKLALKRHTLPTLLHHLGSFKTIGNWKIPQYWGFHIVNKRDLHFAHISHIKGSIDKFRKNAQMDWAAKNVVVIPPLPPEKLRWGNYPSNSNITPLHTQFLRQHLYDHIFDSRKSAGCTYICIQRIREFLWSLLFLSRSARIFLSVVLGFYRIFRSEASRYNCSK